MNNIAVEVEKLGKRYRIGQSNRADTLRDAIAAAVRGRVGRRPPVHEGYQTLWALRDVSFEVKQGEVLGVVGRNGAGKSTLLKILSRVTEPTEGRVSVRGRLGTLLEVGTGFHPELTGRENVYLNGVILGMKRKDVRAKFDEIVAFSGVERFIDTPVKRYSSGMYARLAFAVASSVEPDVLLVDEVLSVGDAEFQKRCFERMQNLSAAGRTVLFISHSMPAVKTLCTRAILLEGGRLVDGGTADEVVTKYLRTDAGPSSDGAIARGAARIGSGTAQFRRAELLDSSGKPVTQLFFGQPFSIALTLEVLEDTEDALLEVGISTMDGTRVTTSFSIDGERPPERLQKGWYRACLDLDPGLLPRQYILDVGVHHLGQGHLTIDFVQGVLALTVLSEPESGNDRHLPNPTRGFVRPIGKWRPPTSVEGPSCTEVS
jgi:lipopolysaccharide transport system ATP-binding protein